MKKLFTILDLVKIIKLLLFVLYIFTFTIRVNGQSMPIFDANVDTLLSPDKNCGALTPIIHGNSVSVTNFHYPTPITDVGNCTAVTYKWQYSDYGTFGTWTDVNSYNLTNLNFPNITYYNPSLTTTRVFYLRRAVFSSCTVPSYSENENWTTPRKFTIYPPFRASIAQTNVLCFGNTTASATATLTGSAPGFVYTWGTSPVQTTTTNSRTNTATNLHAGTITLHVSSVTGCSIDTSIIITQPMQLIAAVGTFTAPSCIADNGTIDINVSGGVLPYNFAWTKNGSPFATTEDLTGLAIGTYVVTVTDVNGCTTTASLTITISNTVPVPAGSITGLTSVCQGQSNVTYTVPTITNATSYVWTLPTGATGTSTTNSITVSYGASTVSGNISIKGNNSCGDGSLSSLNITVNPLPNPVTVSGTGTFNNSAILTASSGSGGTIYWQGTTNDGTSTTTASTTQTVFSSGTYYFRSYNSCGWGTQGSATVTINYTGGVGQPIFDANVDTLLSPDKNCGALTPILHGNAVHVTNNNYPTPITDVGNCTNVTYKWQYSDYGTFGTWTDINSYNLSNFDFPNITYYNPSLTTTRVFYLRRAVFSSCTVIVYSEAEVWTTPRKFTIYPPFRANIAQTNVLCYNNTTASATATLTGSAPGFVYTWGTSPVQTTTTNSRTNTATNLAAGSITLHVSSVTGCSIDTSIIITEPNQLIAAVGSFTSPTCIADNGSIDINESGGVQPYTFAWTKNGSPFATSEDLTGLAVGTYVITVTDANGCTASTSKTLMAPPAIFPTITAFTNVSCYNGSNGTIDLSVSGGTPGFTYAWTKDFMPYATTEDLSNLQAGVYAVTVTDANGCTATITKTITEPAILQVQNLAYNDLTCYQNNSGNINITVTGGTPSYTYAWTKNGSPYSTTEDLTGLTIGTYAVTVTDAKGCTQTANITLIQPALLTAVITSFNNLSCSGSNNGEINLTVGGGTPAYTYAWTKNSSAYATTEDLTAIGAGNYAVTVTDNKGCTATALKSITQPTQLLVNLSTTTNVSCYNGSNGAININVSGGIPAYTYSWTKDFFPYAPTTANISGLTIGRYEVTVTDANGCTATTLYNLTEPAILHFQNIAYNDLTCYQNNSGNINITVAGGTAAYTYAWTKNGSPYSTTEDLTGLTIGAYAVTVTDAKGCTATANKTLIEPALLTAVITSFNNISCNGASDGAINLTAAGGTPPYSYSWKKNGNPIGIYEDITGLGLGNYTVTVTDSKGCIATTLATITQPDLLVVTLGTATNVSCYNGSNGAISINVVGGTVPYTYEWTKDLFPYATTKDLTNLGVGYYVVTLTDAHGCTSTISYNVTEPSIFQVQNIAYFNLTCNGNHSGYMSISVIGENSPYAYTWTKDGSPYIGTTSAINNLSVGDYCVTVTDVNGCTNISACRTILQPAFLTVTVSSYSNINCSGVNNGSINLTVAGGTPSYTYAWTKNGSTFASTKDLSAIGAGTYAVTVTDSQGCSATTSVAIIITNVVPSQAGSITGLTSVCQGQNSVTYTIPVITNATSYIWTLPIGATGTSSTNSITVNYGTTTVSGNITVKGNNSCGNGTASSLAITVNPLPVAAGTISGTTNVCQGQASLTYIVPTITNATSYLWTIPSGSTGTSTTNSITVNYGTSAVSGNIKVKASNSCGIRDSSVLAITVISLPIAAGTITGLTTACQGQSSVNYTVPVITNAISYSWTLPTGATGTSSSNSINVSYGISAISGNIKVKGSNSCGIRDSSVLAITVNPLPAAAGTITGLITVCQGQNIVSYTVPVITNATSYSWTLPTGATGTSSTNSITVNYGTSAVSGNIKVKGSNSCGIRDSSVLAISVNPLPIAAGTISGTTTVCQGQSVIIYTVPAITNATSYLWTLPSGATGTSTTNSISVNYGTSAVSGNIKVKASNSCGTRDSSVLAITVNPLPIAAGSISGSTTVCQGQNSVTYTVPTITNSTSYLWTLPTGATGSSTTNSITVNYGTTAVSGNITVRGNNSCGDGTASTLAITVNPLPISAGTISGSPTVCQGQSGIIYTVPAITNATSYIWTLPSGATGTSTTNSITVNYGTSAVSGNITVKGNNSCGVGNSSGLAITVNPVAVIANQTTTITSGNAFTITPTGVPTGTTYTWPIPIYTGGVYGGSTQLIGQNSISQTLTIPNGTGTAIYTVTPTSGSCIGSTFTITVTVNQTAACTPPWTTVLNQQYNMNVIAKLYLSNLLTTNHTDAIGAFVGQECRGIAYPDPFLDSILFLTITSNVQSGETVTFKAWKSNQCEECPIAETVAFVNQSENGTMSNPSAFHCGFVELCNSFGAGYTWFSVNVNPGSMSLNSLFSNILPCENDRIIGQQSFATYFGNQWVGSLSNIDPTAMYKMKLCSQQTWCKQGSPVSITPINISGGYPWLGYLPQINMPINTALSGIVSAPIANDRFNGQSSFASYSGSQWVGSLTTLQKGKGYIIHLTNPSVLTYASGSGKSSIISNDSQTANSISTNNFKTNAKYNMQIIAKIILPNGNISTSNNDTVFAYAGNECRGIANPQPGIAGNLFLSIGSDVETGEPIHFKVFISSLNQWFDINNNLVFNSEMETGNMQNPYLFNLTGMNGIVKEKAISAFSLGEIYPNPFDKTASLDFKLEKSGNIEATIINELGSVVQIVINEEMQAGSYVLRINRESLSSGLYSLLITYSNKQMRSVISKKMVIK
ncbi:MAG: T9SS type A sorting domain-containing protein [Bacteroidales bacterium]